PRLCREAFQHLDDLFASILTCCDNALCHLAPTRSPDNTGNRWRQKEASRGGRTFLHELGAVGVAGHGLEHVLEVPVAAVPVPDPQQVRLQGLGQQVQVVQPPLGPRPHLEHLRLLVPRYHLGRLQVRPVDLAELGQLAGHNVGDLVLVLSHDHPEGGRRTDVREARNLQVELLLGEAGRQHEQGRVDGRPVVQGHGTPDLPGRLLKDLHLGRPTFVHLLKTSRSSRRNISPNKMNCVDEALTGLWFTHPVVVGHERVVIDVRAKVLLHLIDEVGPAVPQERVVSPVSFQIFPVPSEWIVDGEDHIEHVALKQIRRRTKPCLWLSGSLLRKHAGAIAESEREFTGKGTYYFGPRRRVHHFSGRRHLVRATLI
ncbi:unnamed protein product, partial [Ixodes pacificus]